MSASETQTAPADLQARLTALEAQCAADREELQRESLNAQKLMMMCTKINQKLNLVMDIAKLSRKKDNSLRVAEAGADADATPALMCGFLGKGSSKEKTFKKRWFVLRNGALAYYTSKDATVPKGVIQLSTCIIDGLIVRDGSPLPSMGLTIDGKQTLLQAPSKKEGVAWFLAINCMQQQLDYSRKAAAEGQVPDERLLHFFKQPFRKSLELDDQPLSLDAVAAMESTIRFHSALSTLSFTRARLSDAHMEPLARALAGNKFLRIINLSGNQLSGPGADLLGSALAKNDSITELHLAANQIGDEGAASLAAALPTHRGLRLLDLSQNGIADDGVKALLSALGSAETGIHALMLAQNNVGTPGAASVASFLAKVPAVLKVVCLDDNRIGDDGVVALLEALPSSQVEELFLGGNPFAKGSSTLRRLVAAAVLTTPTLRHLDASPLVLNQPAISALRLLHE
eukprot:c9056_g1_i1.p1 GENE.c9056_g1_i1~~c9056_g1_i1.p1  ORF type:complete len:469 (-),score=104.78 c9056_g1_i1:772-2145(-)